jgi:hypothetical protein
VRISIAAAEAAATAAAQRRAEEAEAAKAQEKEAAARRSKAAAAAAELDRKRRDEERIAKEKEREEQRERDRQRQVAAQTANEERPDSSYASFPFQRTGKQSHFAFSSSGSRPSSNGKQSNGSSGSNRNSRKYSQDLIFVSLMHEKEVHLQTTLAFGTIAPGNSALRPNSWGLPMTSCVYTNLMVWSSKWLRKRCLPKTCDMWRG